MRIVHVKIFAMTKNQCKMQNNLSKSYNFLTCCSQSSCKNQGQGCDYLTPNTCQSWPPECKVNGDDADVFTSQHYLLQAGIFTPPSKWKIYIYYLKIFLFVTIWLIFTTILLLKKEYEPDYNIIAVPSNLTKDYVIAKNVYDKPIKLLLDGPFDSPSNNWVKVWIELILFDEETEEILMRKNVSEEWTLNVVNEDSLEIYELSKQKKIMEIDYEALNRTPNTVLQIKFCTNLNKTLPLILSYNPLSFNPDHGIIYASLILIGLYALIISEIIHRTMSAILASTIAIAFLALLDERPTIEEIFSWIDIDTLLLLTSMMIMVTILTDTGIFDYLSVMAFKVTKGQIWPLINMLCFFTAILSCFLDNVTTALLMTPVTIKLCEVMKLNPVPVLIMMIIFSNIGGAITPIGDPPNVIIASNSQIMDAGVNFLTFTLHMGTGVIVVIVCVYLQLRFFYCNVKKLRGDEPSDVQDLKREIAVWQKTAASLSSYSKDENTVRNTLLKRSTRLLGKLNNKICNKTQSVENYNIDLYNLIEECQIKDVPLLIKSLITLFFVIILFFLHSIPDFCYLGLGWTAILGAILLLLLTERDNLESILARVEWSTLIFFAALFVLMEALSRLGLIDWIGKQTENVIMSVKHENRLMVALLIIMWVSAFASAFVDNIPLTTMMIRIVTNLADNDELKLPLQPLVWALSFGACLGGNGTLFGSSSNIVCAGVAEQHGYRFSFMEFFKIGFPVMIVSMLVINVYLLLAHVVLEWH